MTKDERRAWQNIVQLQIRGTREVFVVATDLCQSGHSKERRLGADILGQLGTPKRPFRRESLRILHHMLRKESKAKVLNSILVAVGHCQKKNDRYGISKICGFHAHRYADVRLGVVMALLARSDKLSVATLVSLSNDKSSQIRDWATFGLGTMIKLDAPKIRNALAQRLTDRDDATRSEAIAGLVKRKDNRGRAVLEHELRRPRPANLILETAAALANQSR